LTVRKQGKFIHSLIHSFNAPNVLDTAYISLSENRYKYVREFTETNQVNSEH